MLLLREAQSFDDGAPVLFALHLLPGKGYCGLVKALCMASPRAPYQIQGALLLQEPAITPAISITLF